MRRRDFVILIGGVALTLPLAARAQQLKVPTVGALDVLADGTVVGRIMKAAAAPVGSPWMWTLAFGYHEDRTPTHGYAETREAAMAAFAKGWRKERWR